MARRASRALAMVALVLSAAALAQAAPPREPRAPRGTSIAQKKVGKAYAKATEQVAAAQANFEATKIKAAADVEATVAQGRAEVASAALGAATRAKVVPLVLLPGKLGQNARAEVAGAASALVASAVSLQQDKVEALQEAAQAVGKAAEKKAQAVAKADAHVDKAVARASHKSGRKVVQLPGAGVAGPSVLPAVAPIVTPAPAAVAGGVGLLGGFPRLGFGGVGNGGKKAGGGGAAANPVASALFGGFGRRRLMQQQPTQPAGLNGGAALAMFAQAAMAFGAQLQQMAQQGQQGQQQGRAGPVLRPEAGVQQPQQQMMQQQQQPYYPPYQQQPQQPQQPLPYNPAALGGFAPALANLAGAGPAVAAPSAGGALSPRAQGIINVVSGGAGLALNAAAPLVRGVASAVPVMVPALDGKNCAAGKPVRVSGEVLCVLGNWEPAANALMNGAGLATAAAGPAASGVANMIAATRANNNAGRGGGGAGRPLGPRNAGQARYLSAAEDAN